MLILGLETSTPAGGVALYGEEGLVAEQTLGPDTTHSQTLLPAVHRVLADAGRTLAAVSALAVSVGPGSFTGVRIGVSTAKGLARVRGIPLVPVSSLLGLAHGFLGCRLPVCTLLDARKGEVYTATYREQRGTMREISPEAVLAPQALPERIREPTLMVGEGALKYATLLREILPERVRFPAGARNRLSAAAVAEIGFERFRSGQGVDARDLVPNYIRRSEAEIAWEKRS